MKALRLSIIVTGIACLIVGIITLLQHRYLLAAINFTDIVGLGLMLLMVRRIHPVPAISSRSVYELYRQMVVIESWPGTGKGNIYVNDGDVFPSYTKSLVEKVEVIGPESYWVTVRIPVMGPLWIVKPVQHPTTVYFSLREYSTLNDVETWDRRAPSKDEVYEAIKHPTCKCYCGECEMDAR